MLIGAVETLDADGCGVIGSCDQGLDKMGLGCGGRHRAGHTSTPASSGGCPPHQMDQACFGLLPLPRSG